MTRRGFLASAAGVVTMALPLHVLRRGRSSLVVLLDLKEHCLGEAVSGYESALTSLGRRFICLEPRLVTRCAVLIVPAACEIPQQVFRAIGTCLDGGSTVVLESGAGFAADPDFRTHRALLRDSLRVYIEAPVDLWAARSRSRGIPYVDYTWPHPAKLRDFSRVVRLGRQAGEIIAWVDGLPVALKRPSGRGTLIFLGSPLGPALWAGDTAARLWLFDVVATSARNRT